jgi:multiple sugar transport system ATP-binding protein
MAKVDVKDISKVFDPGTAQEIYALTHVDLAVADKELLVLLGPSGCGKTTLLRLIAGLEQPTAGAIYIGGTAMKEVRPEDRDVAMVFQRDALYPHMTVAENMAFGLEMRGVSKPDVESRINGVAGALGLAALLNRYPATLSGGQRQRVALARAAVRRPKVFLLDEPLSQLDLPSRTQMRSEILRLHGWAASATLYVTHDQGEAMTLGGRIAVMREGTIQQVADAQTLYKQPANMFVAGFVGSPPMNLIRGRIISANGSFAFQENNPAGVSKGLRLEGPLLPERGQRLSHFAEGNIVLGIRPEHIAVHEVGGSHVPIDMVERLGSESRVHFHTGAHTIIARTHEQFLFAPGERAPLSFDMDRAVFFNPASGAPIV